MSLSEELTWRGFVNQTTISDITELDSQSRTFYFGVDPSADSMTIGNLAAAMMVRHFINHGHKAVLLVGGATGIIGDPDGKKDERNLKTLEEIAGNTQAITAQYKNIFSGNEFTLVDNYDWFKDISYLDFLRNIGKHMSMTQMLDRDFVKSRVGEGGSGISYAEFSYSLIQGYDFLHLFREYGVTLQLCGADQWGNSVTGAGLVRKLEAKEVNVFSTPLVIDRTTGKKFGKSEDGAVWLDERKTSVYKFYQFWLNVDDTGVIDYAKIYTTMSQEDILDLESKHQANPGQRLAQKRLAFEVTSIVHGEQRATAAKNASEILFGQTTGDMDDETYMILSEELPVQPAGQMLSDILIKSSIVGSKGEARRLMAGRAVSINDEKIIVDREITDRCVVRKGKNTFVLITE